MGFPGGSDGKEAAHKAGDQGLSLSWEDPLEKKGQPPPAFLPGEFMDRGTWQATVHGVAKSQSQLSD